MCWFDLQARRWQQFKPSEEYLSIVSGFTTVEKLHNYIKRFHYEWDVIKILWWKFLWDYWQDPEQTLKREAGDCEDSAIFNADVLGRVKNIDAKLILFFGYNRKRFGWKFWMGHAVCVFPYQGKYSVFCNQSLYHNSDNYLQIGHRYYPDGLKYMEVRDWRGNLISRKVKLFGVF
ncbi:hypothetical protein ES705_36634 [subsurface metagenome]